MADAGFEAKADVEAEGWVLGDFLWQINIAVTPGEARAGNADDGVVFADHLDCFAENARVAVEVTLPELIAEHDNRLRVLTVDCVGGDESASESGRNAEEIK